MTKKTTRPTTGKAKAATIRADSAVELNEEQLEEAQGGLSLSLASDYTQKVNKAGPLLLDTRSLTSLSNKAGPL